MTSALHPCPGESECSCWLLYTAHKRDESSAHLLFSDRGDPKLPSNPNGSRIEAHDPLRNAAWFFGLFTLHCYRVSRFNRVRKFFQGEQRNACTNPGIGPHSRRKAHAIQPVIHRQPHTTFDSNRLAHKVAD